MTLQATLQEGSIWLSDAQNNLEIQLTTGKGRHDYYQPQRGHCR